ncbi:dihydrofolate reductase family protein [Streptomyces sp. NPDC090056]|uniref:dihydrofolate reductase family protein n=1 Tax=Streptomyces sp. NPDC090056 TaxID=3365934 RepID=UPI00380563C6
MPYNTAEAAEAVTRQFDDADTALLGRSTYEMWSLFFPHVTSEQIPTADWLNAAPKYVASSTLTGIGQWQGSRLITGDDIAGQIRALKQQPGGNINVGGSITLVQWLMSNGLLDDLYLQIAPSSPGSAVPSPTASRSRCTWRPRGTSTTASSKPTTPPSPADPPDRSVHPRPGKTSACPRRSTRRPPSRWPRPARRHGSCRPPGSPQARSSSPRAWPRA